MQTPIHQNPEPRGANFSQPISAFAFALRGVGKDEAHEVYQQPSTMVAYAAPLSGGCVMSANKPSKANWLGLGRPKKDGSRPFGLTQLAVLQSIHDDPDRAYAVGIAQRLEKAGKVITDGTVVATLHRLERDGFIEVLPPALRQQRTPAKRKQGRPKKHYRITQSGLGLLSQFLGRLAERQTANRTDDKDFSDENPVLSLAEPRMVSF